MLLNSVDLSTKFTSRNSSEEEERMDMISARREWTKLGQDLHLHSEKLYLEEEEKELRNVMGQSCWQ